MQANKDIKIKEIFSYITNKIANRTELGFKGEVLIFPVEKKK